MRKFVTAVVGIAALCGMTAFAQTATTSGAPATTTGENQEGRFRPPHPATDPDMETIHNAIKEAEQNPALLPLLTQALADRATLLQSELNRVTQLQALITAMQGGDKATIQAAHQALKSARETVETNAKAFRESCKAVREAMPHRESHERRAPATSGTGGRD